MRRRVGEDGRDEDLVAVLVVGAASAAVPVAVEDLDALDDARDLLAVHEAREPIAPGVDVVHERALRLLEQRVEDERQRHGREDRPEGRRRGPVLLVHSVSRVVRHCSECFAVCSECFAVSAASVVPAAVATARLWMRLLETWLLVSFAQIAASWSRSMRRLT